MADKYCLHGGAYHTVVDGRAMPQGAVEVPRLPLAGEHWDAQSAAFVTDNEVLADFEVPADHIALAHIIKTVEASLILSGATLTHGLLAEESAETGVTVADLAAAVAAHTAAFRDTERQRRGRKVAARQP